MIEINNLTTNQVDKEFLREVAKKVLISENKERLELSIVLVGQSRIRELNKKYRRKNRVTDVLSFTYRDSIYGSEDEEEGKALFAHDDSGEIVVCLQEIKKNAKKFKSATELPLAEARGKKRTKSSSLFAKELAKVLIHGALHLLGYDHEKGEKEARKMEEKQKYYLKKFF